MGGKLQELIEKLETADKGSRQLNAEVWCHLAGARFIAMSAPDCFKYEPSNKPGLRWGHTLSRKEMVTESIDAARTLVPDRWQWVLYGRTGDTPATAILACSTEAQLSAHHPVTEIALCIAALKARARSPADGKGE